MRTVALIVEGDSDKIIFEKVTSQFSNKFKFAIVPTYGLPKMIKNAQKHYAACKHFHKADYIIFLPDLDNKRCFSNLLNKFCLSGEPNDYYVSILVQEIEAWLLADEPCIRDTLSIQYHVTGYTDDQNDPKEKIKNLVKKNLFFDLSGVELALLFVDKFSCDRAAEHNNSALRFLKIINRFVS